MKKNSVFIFVVLIFLCIPVVVNAHPGRTDANGCHYCRTNCAKWGLSNGEYHCHNNSSSNTETIVKQKSSDNSIKSIIIDGEKITISESMIYQTTKDKLDIIVIPNSEYAEHEIDNTSLSVGENNITIKVTAENGNVKKYNLKVIREELSNNTNVSIKVDNEVIDFNVDKPNITVSSETENLDYSYILEDKNSTLKVTGDKNLKTGENIVTFTVTSQDNTQKDYVLIVNKSENIGAVVFTIAVLSLAGVAGYKYQKKKKQISNASNY